ncbi:MULTISPECIES: enoyl-CoA hydratase [Iodidimonas]|jgi:enoyl-CoA hydratase|uniref:enoyl-CoA hydratase n=1 Tax=Iodidimonas nitroreducens TaxID=1236968 RepID=A0A5A7N4I2_9PROT|nr:MULTISPECIES: enoyl-CoA hydratase [Iodidimonas]GAK32197.1 putative enoyl-CoA hydratase echA8 [alpha proteobacterium Q-1]GER02635.1 enoyl-CoA hydratase [Iodidimonas nitroreducens]
MSYETILLDKREAVGIITLNRPKAMNALNNQLMDELTAALRDLEGDDEIGCILITGSDKAFAAGADIKQMADKSYRDVFMEDFISANWEEASRVRKPIIAAVAGYALGGGCELAMMCDFIIAADTAKFGQPEITIGVIPGAGGTQRLTRFIGKSKAMDMVLTGRHMDAAEALASGLVARVVPADDLLDVALDAAEKIAGFSRPAVMIAKESVNRAYETTLNEGMRFERRVFHSLFAFEDQSEGMAAFIEKRRPQFKNR